MGTEGEEDDDHHHTIDNAPFAFVLVMFAGLATGVGAAFVFNKRMVKLASKRFLAGSLGLAAGVMLYVSLVNIFGESVEAFSHHGIEEADAYLYATLSLFGGMLFYRGIELVVHLLGSRHFGDRNVDITLYDLDGSSSTGTPRSKAAAVAADGDSRSKAAGMAMKIEEPGSDEGPDLAGIGVAPRSTVDFEQPRQAGMTGSGSFPHQHDVVIELSDRGPTVNPSPDLRTLQLRMAGKVQTPQQQQQQQRSGLTPSDNSGCKAARGDGSMEEGHRSVEVEGAASDAQSAAVGTTNATGGPAVGGAAAAPEDDKKLVQMGLLTAVAIGIHNFPDGLATFVATLSDTSVGLALAVAIAIHNIPEGLCVAIPVYYGTGSRWKAFGWALLSGVSEPIGAALGWLILKDVMSEIAYGILFGLVAGIMVNIAIHELIPTAVRYDPADKVTTNSITAGMAIMAASLTLFRRSGGH